MTDWLALAAAAVAWLGTALLALSDGRRGVALGIAVAGIALAVGSAAAGHDRRAAGALALGGVCAAALHLGRGARRWDVMGPGSTPRVMGCLVALIVTFLVAGTGVQDPVGVARLGATLVAVTAAGRLLTVRQRWAALGAGSALALGLGSLGTAPDVYLAAAIACGLGFVSIVAGPVEAGA